MTKNQYINREISWLRFNERVLQESADPQVPLIERFRFLGIFSNNLDEFFKVRYATVKRVVDAGAKLKGVLGDEKPKALLDEITKIVIAQQKQSLEILKNIPIPLVPILKHYWMPIVIFYLYLMCKKFTQMDLMQ